MQKTEFISEGLRLEARFRPGLAEAFSSGKPPVTVICHPHPQFGGSMNNNVVFSLEQAFTERGFATLSFNFRGVENSEGEYGEMRGETEDVISALSYAGTRHDVDPESICLAGYSFGALMALHAAAKVMAYEGFERGKESVGAARGARALALVSPMPPVGGWDNDQSLSNLVRNPPPAFIVTGTQDRFCPVKSAKDLAVKVGPNTRLAIVEGADHFYFEREHEAAIPAADFAASILAS